MARETVQGSPPAKDVVLGYIDAFDPDILVQFSGEVPQYIQQRGLKIIRPDEIWQTLDERVVPRQNYIRTLRGTDSSIRTQFSCLNCRRESRRSPTTDRHEDNSEWQRKIGEHTSPTGFSAIQETGLKLATAATSSSYIS
jgi:hypothetical protein